MLDKENLFIKIMTSKFRYDINKIVVKYLSLTLVGFLKERLLSEKFFRLNL